MGRNVEEKISVAVKVSTGEGSRTGNSDEDSGEKKPEGRKDKTQQSQVTSGAENSDTLAVVPQSSKIQGTNGIVHN